MKGGYSVVEDGDVHMQDDQEEDQERNILKDNIRYDMHHQVDQINFKTNLKDINQGSQPCKLAGCVLRRRSFAKIWTSNIFN